MKIFHFFRHEDQSGVSGAGAVAEGVIFSNGWCAVRWLSAQSSLCFYQSMQDVRAIHGHGGRTEIVVHDFEPSPPVSGMDENDPRNEVLLRIIDQAATLMVLFEEADSDFRGPLSEIEKSMDLLRELLVGRNSRTKAAG